MKIAEWISRLGEVWVEGQIAQLTTRAATAFLVLRDPAADISVPVTCRRELLAATPLAEGARVVLRARPDYYTARGSLSLRASEIRPVGLGELLARLEKLKRLLSAEGLFDPARKRPLPFVPRLVGLVTGRASAAERDVRENAGRRWPAVRFRVENVAVQGALAVPQLIEAVRRLDADPEVDVIVLARGGGSVEDLLPFSDEALCRAVAACLTPVVAAIGHEPDSPLLDLVADVRCSTPTDAGRRIVPDVAEQQSIVDTLRRRAERAVRSRLDTEAHRLAGLRGRRVLADPLDIVYTRQSDVDALASRARRSVQHALSAADADLGHLRARVAALSPAATLRRGYAVVQRADGTVVRRPAEVHPGEAVRIRLAEGAIQAEVRAEVRTEAARSARPPADGPAQPAPVVESVEERAG
jgi:exodeoxyribonuclease VII large subunit